MLQVEYAASRMCCATASESIVYVLLCPAVQSKCLADLRSITSIECVMRCRMPKSVRRGLVHRIWVERALSALNMMVWQCWLPASQHVSASQRGLAEGAAAPLPLPVSLPTELDESSLLGACFHPVLVSNDTARGSGAAPQR